MQDAIPLLYFFGLLVTLMFVYWCGMRAERRAWTEREWTKAKDRYRDEDRKRDRGWNSCNILDDPE